MPELDGRVAVVTGAAQGIGRAAAGALARQGARLVLVDRDGPSLSVAGAELAARGNDVEEHTLDVSDPDAVVALSAALLARHDGVDVLVNSAGIQRYGTVVTTTPLIWEEVMAVNVRSQFLMCRALMPSLAARRGAVVNVASVQALGARKDSAAYVASKHAVLGLTRAMALDHAPEVRVNCVAPGSVDTPMLRRAAIELGDDPAAAIAEWGALHPLARVATADEVGEVIAFLAGPRASFVSGACWEVDGALLAGIG